MPLVHDTYGKGRVRVMRVKRDTERHEVRELNVKVMLKGDFARAFTHADNRAVVATDTIKNIVNIVASEQVGAENEAFCGAVARRYLERYEHVEQVAVTASETKWTRLDVDGAPHPHSFVLDGNGKALVEVTATRDGLTTRSGVEGFTFLKSTGSGWENYLMDDYTTIPETADRICSTSMDARWTWAQAPGSYEEANAKVLATLLEVFATTYSYGVQDSLYRMGEAALAAIPEIADISMACPNKHYLAINLKPFGIENDRQVFVPTDEPHGQIECRMARG